MALFSLSKSYNFGDVVLTVGGQRIKGFDDDGTISIEFTGDDATMSQGADGEVVVNQLPAMPAEVTITLKETSSSNSVLMALREAQRLAAAGYVMPFGCIDSTTGEQVSSLECVFANRPGVSKGREAGTREWKLLLPHPIFTPALP